VFPLFTVGPLLSVYLQCEVFRTEVIEKNKTHVVKVFYSPTNAQVMVLKTVFKFTLKTAPTCFGAVTPSSGSALFVLAKVTVVKIAAYGTSVCD